MMSARARVSAGRAAAPGLLVILTCLSAPAVGQTEHPRWFSTFHYGVSDYDVALTGDGPWWGDVDDDGQGLALGFGYNVSPTLAFRLMLERNAGINVANRCPDVMICPAVSFRESTIAWNWSAALMPRLRFGAGWEIYGIAGALHWRIDPEGVISRDSGNRLLYGGGLGLRLANGLGIAAEYQEAGNRFQSLRLNVSFEF